MKFYKMISLAMLRVVFLLGLLLTGCQYVSSKNIYDGLLDSDHNLLYQSDPLANYQYDLTAEMTVSAQGESTRIIFEGAGAMRVHDDSLVPDMQITLNISAPDVPDSGTGVFEIVSVGDTLYQRTSGSGLDGRWYITTLPDLLTSNGIMLPLPGETVPDNIQDLFGTFDSLEISNYTQIERVADTTVLGENSAHFVINLDVKQYLLDGGFLALSDPDTLRDLGIDPDAYSEEELDEILRQSIDQTYQTFTLQVDQYVNIDTGLQNRSVTDIEFTVLNPDPEDPTVTGTPVSTRFYIDTYYRDYYQPLEIIAPVDTSPSPSPVNDNVAPAPPPVSVSQIPVVITPTSASGNLCSTACLSETFTISFPEQQAPPLDLVILLDTTSSMDDEITEVQQTIQTIVTDLQRRVPDARFALAIFADHPNFDSDVNGDDIPYQLAADFTTDINTLESAVNQVELMNGGRFPESTLYALTQLDDLNWRPDAIHLTVMFTDALPHVPDPGLDAVIGTSDDITTNQAIQALNDDQIHLINIQSQLDDSFVPEVRSYLQDLADRTGGLYVPLEETSDIPQAMSEAVGLFVGGDLSFVTTEQNFGFLGNAADSDWLTFSPAVFPYPPQGGNVAVTMQICPGLANLADDTYQMTIELQDNSQSYGNVEVDFSYSRLCSNVYVSDTPEDQGLICSDINAETVYWQSPDIIIRQQADNGRISEIPVLQATNFIYVRTHNRGPEPTEAAQIEVFTNSNPFSVDFASDWQLIGQERLTLGVDEDYWAGPFEWVPINNEIAIRAAISTVEDQITLPNDFACDDNIAQYNVIYMTLDTPSYGRGLLGGELPLQIEAPQNIAYNALDFHLSIDPILSDSGLIRLTLDNNTFQNWQDRNQLPSGGVVSGYNQIELTNGEPRLVLNELVGGPTVQMNALLYIATGSNATGVIPISLRAADRTWLGASIIYEVDASAVPAQNALAPKAQPKPPTWQQPSSIVPIILLFGLVLLAVVVYAKRKRGA